MLATQLLTTRAIVAADPDPLLPPVRRSLGELAPRMAAAVRATVAECHAAGLDVHVYEALRLCARQSHYFRQGASRARCHRFSWHGYGLAVDLISRARGWNAGEAWFGRVADVAARHGLDWGGLWRFRDLPHFQWGRCRISPSDRARELLATRGVRGVWAEVGAV